eukprot:TRINITY_DN25910_c0_g1_i1.p1 TRINITY_DN25910_c0_g1~~TRINITY_DN25910_c0_g1_i1.p1  ORF type:complete len:630 (+),score=102.22 TRINITY_DN25910_c0_g1_i1:166-2055(+)
MGNGALVRAAGQNSVQPVKLLLHLPGISPTSTGHGGDTALTAATRKNQVQVARLLLDHARLEPALNARSKCGHTALMVAASEGHVEMVRLLLRQPGVDLNAKVEVGPPKATLLMQLCGRRYFGSGERGDTALIFAAREGNAEVVKLLLEENGLDLNAESFRRNALAWAARKGHAEVLRLLLSQPTCNASQAFCEACKRQDAEMAKELLLYAPGCHNTTDGGGADTPLMLAVQGRQNDGTSLLQLLLEEPGLQLNAQNGRGDTALHCAIRRENVEAVRLLLKMEGLDVNVRNTSRQTPFMLSDSVCRPAFELLLDHQGCNFNFQDQHGFSPLSLALLNGNLDKVRLLLGKDSVSTSGSDPTDSDKDTSLLKIALDQPDPTFFELMLAHPRTGEYDLNRQTKEMGWTILHHAIRSNKLDGVKLLMSKEALNVNCVSNERSQKETPLVLAINRCRTDAAVVLCGRSDLDVNARDWWGATPLILAAKKGQVEVVRCLLGCPGVDINAKQTKNHKSKPIGVRDPDDCYEGRLTEHGWTAVHEAAKFGHAEVLELLLSQGGDVNALSEPDGNTPLHCVAASNPESHRSVVELLLESKAKINAKNPRGRTPLSMARVPQSSWYSEVGDFLRTKGAV